MKSCSKMDERPECYPIYRAILYYGPPSFEFVFIFQGAGKILRNLFFPIFMKICTPPFSMMLITNKWVWDAKKIGIYNFSAIFGEKVYVTGKLIKIKP